MKKCSKCLCEKSLNEFRLRTSKNKKNPFRVSYCKICEKEWDKDYKSKHLEQSSKRTLEYRHSNLEKWRKYHREYLKKYHKNPINRKKDVVRHRLWKAKRDGKVIKKEKCETCGGGPTNAHHVEKSVGWLKRTARIATRKTTRGIVIFVLGYAKYQDANNYGGDAESDTKSGIEATQERHYTQEGNKERKEKHLDCVFLTMGEKGKLEEGFGANVTADYIARVNNYKKAHGKEYKSEMTTRNHLM